MIKVQTLLGSTLNTSTSIPLPNEEAHLTRDRLSAITSVDGRHHGRRCMSLLYLPLAKARLLCNEGRYVVGI